MNNREIVLCICMSFLIIGLILGIVIPIFLGIGFYFDIFPIEIF
jgi:flagellar biosynthesis protein FliQ